MYALAQLFMALGLVALLASCTFGPFLGLHSYTIAFGMLIVGALLRLSSHRPQADPERPTPDTHVRCPDCRELVRADARKCRHCGTALIPVDPQATPAGPPGPRLRQPDWTTIVVALIVITILYKWLT